MTITLSDINEWRQPSNTKLESSKRSTFVHDLTNGLSLLSFDATVNIYDYLRVPNIFIHGGRLLLQDMWKYNRAKIKTTDQMEQMVVDAFQYLAKRRGMDFVWALGLWLASTQSFSAADDFHDDLRSIKYEYEYRHAKILIPPRIQRYYAYCDIADSVPYLADEFLLPERLKTRWDKKMYAAYYDPDPDEECNTWHPEVEGNLRSHLIQGRIDWENVCMDPPPTQDELREIGLWVDEYRKKSNGPEKPPADPNVMFLPERLRRDYVAIGYIKK